MKNNIEKVYNKLPKKVNLKNHKVDLSLIGDIEELNTKVEEQAKELDNEVARMINVIADLMLEVGSLDILYNNLANDANDLIIKSEQLQDALDEIGVGGNTTDANINATMVINYVEQVYQEYLNVTDAVNKIDLRS
tara:strand:+ start:335 stop:742 length:408 start_codon:yes stop_codon:yes gene_type:complete